MRTQRKGRWLLTQPLFGARILLRKILSYSPCPRYIRPGGKSHGRKARADHGRGHEPSERG